MEFLLPIQVGTLILPYSRRRTLKRRECENFISCLRGQREEIKLRGLPPVQKMASTHVCDLLAQSTSIHQQFDHSKLSFLLRALHGRREGRRRILLHWPAFFFTLEAMKLLEANHYGAGLSHTTQVLWQ